VADFAKASAAMLDVIKSLSANGKLNDFPELELVQALLNKALALPMRSPDFYQDDQILKNVVICSAEPADQIKILRGEQRFSFPENSMTEVQRAEMQNAIKLYRRFCEPWTHRHEILLWLQRRYVVKKFEKCPVLPGSEDETPYDYDHICPQSDWAGWTGSGGDATAILAFRQENGAEHVLGNSIGNVRVWDSSENRSDGAASPGLKQSNSDNNNLSLVGQYDDRDELEAWQACSGDRDGEHLNRVWNVERSKAFQRAIERRTFNLFKKFHSDLDFSKYPLQVNG
jgi:hypothetical protein